MMMVYEQKQTDMLCFGHELFRQVWATFLPQHQSSRAGEAASPTRRPLRPLGWHVVAAFST